MHSVYYTRSYNHVLRIRQCHSPRRWRPLVVCLCACSLDSCHVVLGSCKQPPDTILCCRLVGRKLELHVLLTPRAWCHVAVPYAVSRLVVCENLISALECAFPLTELQFEWPETGCNEIGTWIICQKFNTVLRVAPDAWQSPRIKPVPQILNYEYGLFQRNLIDSSSLWRREVFICMDIDE